MIWNSLEQLASEVQSGKTSATALVEKSLQLIDSNKSYNAVIGINANALKTAAEIDARIAAGEKVGRLAGIPFIAKDNYLTKGVETTAAAAILKGFVPPYSATAITALEAEGAILVAKANLDAFAHGSSTENSHFGPTRNPHDQTRVPGGSSGGSGAAVALELAPFALGTDTGGSIRLPAAFCGVVGLKPTYGLISRYGVVAMASSTDVLGPITRTVADAALLLDIMAGRDAFDGTTIERDDSYIVEASSLAGLKIGIVKEYFEDGLSDEVRTSIQSVIDMAKAAGAEVSEVSLPALQYALACYYVLVPAEVSSNLSRYDGIRFGQSAQHATTLDDVYELTRAEGFHAENQRRIMIGTYVLSHGYYDAYYKKAQSVRTLLVDEFNAAFDSYDILLGPTSPTTAFTLGQNVEDPLQMYLADIMTVAVNLAGIPAISIPAPTNGLPIGLQLMGRQTSDKKLLSIAQSFESLIEANQMKGTR
jgi:aspartyl-tRNA(Asn)/glutamyl-tRNA(Gln) amidotransferase subunit A